MNGALLNNFFCETGAPARALHLPPLRRTAVLLLLRLVGLGARRVEGERVPAARLERIRVKVVVKLGDEAVSVLGVLIMHAAEDYQPSLGRVQRHRVARTRRGRGAGARRGPARRRASARPAPARWR